MALHLRSRGDGDNGALEALLRAAEAADHPRAAVRAIARSHPADVYGAPGFEVVRGLPLVWRALSEVPLRVVLAMWASARAARRSGRSVPRTSEMLARCPRRCIAEVLSQLGHGP